MKDFTTAQEANALLKGVRGLIDAINRRTEAERRKIITAKAKGQFTLTADEIAVVYALYAQDCKVPLKEVVKILTEAKQEPVHASTVSSMLTRLKNYKLLEREENDKDKRQDLNSLTPEGKELAQRLRLVDELVTKNVVDALQLDADLAADLSHRVARANDRIREQLHRAQTQTKPSPAGVYDFLLNGICHTDLDREFVDEKAQIQRQQSALSNRAFLQRAVRFLAQEKHMRQFLDVGSGYPTNCNTHDVLRLAKIPANITYVDNDADVAQASRLLLQDVEHARFSEQDVRFIKRWLKPDRFQNIDLSKPVAVLLVALFHFLPDDSEVRDILQFLKQRLAPGSYLAISHSSPELMTEEYAQKIQAQYAAHVAPIKLRTKEKLLSFLEGFKLVEPGLVPISDWKPKIEDMLTQQIPRAESSLLACVAEI